MICVNELSPSERVKRWGGAYMPKSVMTISDKGSSVRKMMLSGLSERRNGVTAEKNGREWVGSNVLGVPVKNVMTVHVLYAGQYRSRNGNGISHCEASPQIRSKSTPQMAIWNLDSNHS
jgi:hypothetical protein